MTEEEKLKFLKKMGYSGSDLRVVDANDSSDKPKKEKKDNHVDKNELLELNRIFNPEK